jgi:hypothetical protein
VGTESKIREFVIQRSSREERAPQRVGSVSAYLGDRWISALRGGDTGFHSPLFSLHQSPESFAGLVKLRF